MKDPYKKWRDDLVYFLDECFDGDDAYNALLAEGFRLQRHRIHFTNGLGVREHNVLDPRVLALCNQHGWIVVTTDGNIYNMHRKEVAAAKSIGVIATGHNNPEDIMEWVNGLIKLRPRIEKNNFKKKHRPWFLQFNRQGQITVEPKLVKWP